MKWFKHFACAQDSEDLSDLIGKFGAQGYGVWWMILEKIAALMNDTERCYATYSVQKWCRSLAVRRYKLNLYLVYLQKRSLVSYKMVDDQLTIECPKLLKYRDEWTERRTKKSVGYSGVTRELLGSNSGTEAEAEAETESETERTRESLKLNVKDNSCTSTGLSARAFYEFFEKEIPGALPNIKTRLMIGEWVEQGVTLDDLKIAVEDAKSRNVFPQSPNYYHKKAAEVCSLRQNGVVNGCVAGKNLKSVEVSVREEMARKRFLAKFENNDLGGNENAT
jgi:hypothetical protein